LAYGSLDRKAGPTPSKKAKSKKGKKDDKSISKAGDAADDVADDMLLELASTEFGPVLAAMRLVCEKLLARHSAYSPILLGEALAAVSPSTAALLLRIFVHLLRGLCAIVYRKDSAIHLGMLGDREITRACGWVEALLDAHFSSLALNAISHQSTRQALAAALECIASAEQIMEQVEGTIGLWGHISRASKQGTTSIGPPSGLYRLESVTF
jgi:hypothetical protein